VSHPEPNERQQAWDLVAHLLGAGDAPPSRVDSKVLEKVVSWHAMEAALGDDRRAAAEDRVEPAIRAEWRHASLAAFGESVWRFERVRRVLQQLAPIPVVVFKGFAYAELVYPSPGGRSMGDVDLLVAPENVGEVVERLKALGFAPEEALDLEAESSFEWKLKRPNLELDVHRGISYPARLHVDCAAVVARSIPWDDLGPNARLLSPPDAVLVHALQAPLAEFAPGSAPAMGAFDLRLMLQREGPFWGKVPSPPLDRRSVPRLAAQWRVSRMLYAGLRWLEQLFPDTAIALTDLMPDLPRSVAKAIDTRVVSRAYPPATEVPTFGERMIRRWILTEPRERFGVAAQMLQRWGGR
jgi:hypothetical protein